MTKFLSRKFIIAMIFSITGCGVFALTGKLSGGEFVTLALGIPGLFTAGDTALNYIHRDKQDPDNPGK